MTLKQTTKNKIKKAPLNLDPTPNAKPDTSGLRSIKISKDSIMEYELTLLKNSGSKLVHLAHTQIQTITVASGSLYEISFTVPKYFTDELSFEVIENPEYDLVLHKQIVQLNGVDKFVIQDVVENDGESGDSIGGTNYTSKSVTAYSLETNLNTRKIVLTDMEAQLYEGDVNIAKGYLNYVDETSSWKLNYLDPNAVVEHWNGGTNNKYREVGSVNTDIYPFLTTTLPPLFNTITFFNSHNRTYDVFDLDTYGTKRPYIISLDNIVTDFQRETNIANIVTRLHCTGQNNLVFTDINPLGTDYIDDLTHYRNKTYMSQPLLEALDRYDLMTGNLHKEFVGIRSNLTKAQTVLNNMQPNIDNLKSNEVIYGQEQSAYLKSLSNYPKGNATLSASLKALKVTMDANKKSLQTALAEKSKAQDNYNAIFKQLKGIASQYDLKTSKDSQGLIFTQELIDEYDSFIIEGDYSNISCTTAEELMKQGEKYLKTNAEPVFTFTLGVNDFLQGIPFNEEEKMEITLVLGDLVRVVNDLLKIDTYVRFVGYSVTPLSDELTMTFSTTSVQQTPMSDFANAMSTLNDTAQAVNINKYFWNMSKDTANWVENFRTNSLNLVAQEIKSKTSDNEIDINENGIYLIDANNTKDQLAMTNNIIAMTTDGWETAKVAITPNWINGSLICAESIATESLSLSTQEQVKSGVKALDGVATLTQEFTVAKGEVESQIKEKIGVDEMWTDLKQSASKFNALVEETTAMGTAYSDISETKDKIEWIVSKDGFSTILSENSDSVRIAWNKNSSSIDFTDTGEIICTGTNGDKVTISGNGGITYSNGGSGGSSGSNSGGTSGLTTATFICEQKIQNGYTGTINLPSIFNGKVLGQDYQFTCWAGNIDSNYNEVFNKDALRNVFVNVVSNDNANGTVTVMPCIQKIGLETLTMWGWDSKTTTSGNKECEGMINVICYASLLTSPIS